MAGIKLTGLMKNETAVSAYEEMLEGYEKIPRDTAEKSSKGSVQQGEPAENKKEQKAIKDMRRLLVLLEKSIIGNQDEKDKRELRDNAKQWTESIAVLKEYIEVSEAKQTQQEPIPMRENWELEGIIPFEVFVKIDFPKTYKSGNDDIDSQWFNAAHAVAGYKIHDIDCALTYAEQMKTAPLKDLPDCGSMLEYYIISSFEAIAKWMAAYSIIAAKIFDETEVPMHPFLKEQIDVIESLIKLEIETGIFAPLDKMVIEANGWDIDEVKINNCTDAAEQIKAEILEQFKTKCT